MIRLSLRVKFKVLGVPYLWPESDPNSASYIDLRREPDRIGELPELHRWPVLRATVELLNSPSGQFRSIGCEHVASEWGPAAEAVQYCGYVGYCWANNDWNQDVLHYYAHFRRLSQFVNESPQLRTAADGTSVIFEPLQTAYREANFVGWGVDYWFQGIGESEAAARVRAEPGLLALRSFVQLENECLRAL